MLNIFVRKVKKNQFSNTVCHQIRAVSPVPSASWPSSGVHEDAFLLCKQVFDLFSGKVKQNDQKYHRRKSSVKIQEVRYVANVAEKT